MPIPDQSDVDQLRKLLDLMANFPDNDQRARYLLSSNWMQGKSEQVEIVRSLGRAEAERAAYEAMDAERRTWESRRAVENVALAELQRERDKLRDFQERVTTTSQDFTGPGRLTNDQRRELCNTIGGDVLIAFLSEWQPALFEELVRRYRPEMLAAAYLAAWVSK